MAADPYKNYFLERTKGAVKDNFIIQLSQFKLYENGNLIQQGTFPRDYDDFDITLILKEDTLILQCFGLGPFDIRTHNYLTVEKSGVFAQEEGVSYIASFLLINNHYSVNPGQVPYKITITTYKDSIYSLSLFFEINDNERELELFGESEWFIMPDSKPANEPKDDSTDDSSEGLGIPF